MKHCVTYEKQLWLDVYGELSREAQAELVRHLERCPGCRREHRMLSELVAGAADRRPTAVLTAAESARLTRHVMRTLDPTAGRGAVSSSRPTGFPGRLSGLGEWFGRWTAWGPMAAAACVLIVAGGLFWGGFQTGPERGEPLQTVAGIELGQRIPAEDLEVIRHLDLLEDLEQVEKLVRVTDPPAGDAPGPDPHRTMRQRGAGGEMDRRHAA